MMGSDGTGRGPRGGLGNHAGRRALDAAIVAAAVLLAPSELWAFCRSTTCTGDCPRDAYDCKTSGEPLWWSSMCVGFSLQKDGSVNLPFEEIERVVNASFAAWSDLECPTGPATLAFSRLADVSCHNAEYNPDGANANIVLFQDNKWNYTGEFNTLAKTTVTYDNGTGEIFDADIEINHAFNEYTTGDSNVIYDLQSVLTHEIGHLFGLDHSDYPLATMTPDYQAGSTELRTLEADDIDGVCAVYPPERPAVCSIEPRGGLGDQCAAEAEDDSGCSLARASSAGTTRLSRGPWSWALGLAVGVRALRRVGRNGNRSHRRGRS